MNSAREIATGPTFLAESEAQSQRPSRGSETCRGEPERFKGLQGRPAGSRHPSGGCTSLHLATCGRKVEADAPCDDPASKARNWYQAYGGPLTRRCQYV